MSLMICPECGYEHSDQAASCPKCGRPNQLIQEPKQEKVVKKGGCATGCLAVFGVFIGISIIGGVISNINTPKKAAEESKQSLNLGDNEVGAPLVMGRSGCKRTLKQVLRDPESLQGDEYTVVEASPEKWTAKILFRSRNGFGGMNAGEAVCSFDGSTYQVQVTSDQ